MFFPINMYLEACFEVIQKMDVTAPSSDKQTELIFIQQNRKL